MDKYKGNWTDIFRSKRFIAAGVGLVVMLLVAAIPELEASEDIIIESLVVLIGVLIGGYSIQDAITAARGPQDKKPE